MFIYTVEYLKKITANNNVALISAMLDESKEESIGCYHEQIMRLIPLLQDDRGNAMPYILYLILNNKVDIIKVIHFDEVLARQIIDFVESDGHHIMKFLAIHLNTKELFDALSPLLGYLFALARPLYSQAKSSDQLPLFLAMSLDNRVMMEYLCDFIEGDVQDLLCNTSLYIQSEASFDLIRPFIHRSIQTRVYGELFKRVEGHTALATAVKRRKVFLCKTIIDLFITQHASQPLPMSAQSFKRMFSHSTQRGHISLYDYHLSLPDLNDEISALLYSVGVPFFNQGDSRMANEDDSPYSNPDIFLKSIRGQADARTFHHDDAYWISLLNEINHSRPKTLYEKKLGTKYEGMIDSIEGRARAKPIQHNVTQHINMLADLMYYLNLDALAIQREDERVHYSVSNTTLRCLRSWRDTDPHQSPYTDYFINLTIFGFLLTGLVFLGFLTSQRESQYYHSLAGLQHDYPLYARKGDITHCNKLFTDLPSPPPHSDFCNSTNPAPCEEFPHRYRVCHRLAVEYGFLMSAMVFITVMYCFAYFTKVMCCQMSELREHESDIFNCYVPLNFWLYKLPPRAVLTCMESASYQERVIDLSNRIVVYKKLLEMSSRFFDVNKDKRSIENMLDMLSDPSRRFSYDDIKAVSELFTQLIRKHDYTLLATHLAVSQRLPEAEMAEIIALFKTIHEHSAPEEEVAEHPRAVLLTQMV